MEFRINQARDGRWEITEWVGAEWNHPEWALAAISGAQDIKH